ncbi:E3 ubiquitin-protein ligase RHA2A-like [Primulina eburnea]|uniref:E3 ubiquitin-protein ligase RHA2A-like n=1 Tax=Primulina eburnea TaxID=1245227 RepID=UPI003C6C20CC
MKLLEKNLTRQKRRKMGLLHNQISESDSILIFTVIVIAKSVRYLHSIVSTMMRTIGLLSPLCDPPDDHHHHQVYDVVGSGLANLILLCDQLSMNRELSFPVQPDDFDSDCVVCLNRLGDEGDYVRELACGHMFHKDCFAGWLDQLNFNCPICRQPLAQDGRLDCTQRRLADDLLSSS